MARKPNATPPTNGFDDQADDDLPKVIEDGLEASAADPALSDDSTKSVEEQLAELKARNERMERENAELRQRSSKQEVDLFETQRAVIERAIGEADREKSDIRRQIVEAKQAGDYEKEVELLDQISQINAKINTLNSGKNQLDIRAEEMKDIPADPVEAYTMNMQPRAKAWVRSHPEVVTDKALNEELTAAHFRALGQKMVAGTDEYFAYLEGELFDKREEPPKREEPRRENARTTFTAPVGREAGGGVDLPRGVSRRPDGTYRLSPEQLEAARISNIAPAVYLKNLLEIHKERGGSTLN